MTIRITPNLDDTEKLLEQILLVIMKDGERVAFCVPAGSSYHVMQRIRVMISRKRKKMMQLGKRPKRFELKSTVHQETHDGLRYDCIVMWKRIAESHKMLETLEDLLA